MKIFNFNISSAVLLLLGIILFALVVRPRASPKEGFKLFANPIKEVKSVMEGLGLVGTSSDSKDDSDNDNDDSDEDSDEDSDNDNDDDSDSD